MFENLPSDRGSYLLVLQIDQWLELSVGRLGLFSFPAGSYVYCGSAMGSGGIRGRLKHHLKIHTSPRWHLDYLRAHSEVVEVICWPAQERLECRWSQFFLDQSSAFIPAAGFGASDCRNGCAAHLIGFPENQISQILRNFTLAWNCQRLPIQ